MTLKYNNLAPDEGKPDREAKLGAWIRKLYLNFPIIRCEELLSADDIMVPFKGRYVPLM